LSVAIRITALAGAALLPAVALAELHNESIVGPGLRTRPAYDGSRSQHGELVPVVRYLGEPWFVRSTQGVLEGGVRWGLSTDLHVGAQLAYEPGRQSSESGFLESRQVASVSRGASVGLQMEWDHRFGPMPITLLVRSRTATQSARGTQADFRLSAGVFQSGSFSAGVFTQASWADAKSTSTYYGIGAQASASTGLPGFEPAGGLLYTSLGLLWSIDLRAPWVIVGNLEARRLRGDAAQSPLTERRSNHYASVGLAYRF
jgi:outer membrane scaffolding protein for murein synthesis (MipA/OmpV family)